MSAVTEATGDRLILDPSERRAAFLQVIEAARERIALSMFRCTDFRIMDSLADALARGVRVDLLLTPHARGWEKKIHELGEYLGSMGAHVHRYSVPGARYHAKYLVADKARGIVASLNLTTKCFDSTADFLVITEDVSVVRSLLRLFEHDSAAPETPLPEGLSRRLLIGPENARERFFRLISEASQSIRIVDHKLKDADMLAMLATQQVSGCRVEIFGEASMAPWRSHGKMMLIDDRVAVIGSISLSPANLETGRELAIVVDDPGCVSELSGFLRGFRPGKLFAKREEPE